jgi:hypothetical protein
MSHSHCFCSQPFLAELAARTETLAQLLLVPSAQTGDFARDTVFNGIELQRELVHELLACADCPDAGALPEDDLIEVDRNALLMACHSLLHAFRAHEDGRSTVSEEKPWEAMIGVACCLWDLAGLTDEEEREAVHRRLRLRSYLADDSGDDELTAEVPSGMLPVSADQLSDFAQQLDAAAGALRRRGPLPFGLVSVGFRFLLETAGDLREHSATCRLLQHQPQVRSPRFVPFAVAERWTERAVDAAYSGDAKALTDLSVEVERYAG